ncbi:hypothetical protein B0H67DRAFT_144609 [Lasiosphaeris hirsuta]|uniref:Mg2+ transporter protein, CorA-like/Zinc transport protein ZntB n=1 Tax=Lasiosphaeris hirsuta TaxID=260670 RepID=A0AA40B1Z2_9PEZI|nr:hypothetical protein B0H67DRAFT_144609 [Lasiosphaeris hirsuta]
MDKFLFDRCLGKFEFAPEDAPVEMKYLELLNYNGQEPSPYDSGMHKLSVHDFDNFIARKGVFSTPSLEGTTSGHRLLIQDAVQDAKAFDQNVMSLTEKQYRTLTQEMRLPPQVAESSSVVGPFFWWRSWRDLTDPKSEFLRKNSGSRRYRVSKMVFRKSDVKWKGTSRGWEMALSYSFRTRITSGYIRGTESARIGIMVESLQACAKTASHPFLLPVLMLGSDLSPIESDQRVIRDTLRSLESAVGGGRYNIEPAEGYGPETDIKLDQINRELADLQCRVMWKRPQAWQSAVGRLNDATMRFWERLPEEDRRGRDLESLHMTIQARLDFTTVRLEGLESYTQVSLERLNIQREVMNSFISQRESRLSLAIAAQQQRLAHAAGRESTSMKTLTLLGAMFLPGAFLSSMFGTSFFDFGSDVHGRSVSPRVWIYFATSIPLTLLIVGAWWAFDQRHLKQANAEVSDDEMNRLENRVMKAIRTRTGARVMSEGPHLVHSSELHRQDHISDGNTDDGSRGIIRWLEPMTSWRQKSAAPLADEP